MRATLQVVEHELEDREVAVAGDGQELGDALNQAEDEGFKPTHTLSCLQRGRGPVKRNARRENDRPARSRALEGRTTDVARFRRAQARMKLNAPAVALSGGLQLGPRQRHVPEAAVERQDDGRPGE